MVFWTFQTVVVQNVPKAMLPVCPEVEWQPKSGSQSNWTTIQDPLTALVLLSIDSLVDPLAKGSNPQMQFQQLSFGSLVSIKHCHFCTLRGDCTTSPIPNQHQYYPTSSQHESGCYPALIPSTCKSRGVPAPAVAGVLRASAATD